MSPPRWHPTPIFPPQRTPAQPCIGPVPPPSWDTWGSYPYGGRPTLIARMAPFSYEESPLHALDKKLSTAMLAHIRSGEPPPSPIANRGAHVHLRATIAVRDQTCLCYFEYALGMKQTWQLCCASRQWLAEFQRIALVRRLLIDRKTCQADAHASPVFAWTHYRWVDASRPFNYLGPCKTVLVMPGPPMLPQNPPMNNTREVTLDLPPGCV